MPKNEYFSTIQAAEKLGISRVAVFKKIKKGEIRASKVGRNFIINQKEVKRLMDRNNKEIERAVKKVIKEYGETLRLLGSNK